MDTNRSRRRFLTRTVFTAAALPFWLPSVNKEAGPDPQADLPDVHIFSKHLQFLNYTDMAQAAAAMGFAGVDLSVRPEGHVLPERVADDLPRAAEALRKAGLPPQLMTTAVGDAGNATDVRVLETAAHLGFTLYRMTWYPYRDGQTIPESIRHFQQQIQALSELNKTLGLTGCYQNHAGLLAGATVWEVWEMLKTANSGHMGAQFDIRHAMVEGGQSWPNGLRLLMPQIKSLTIKDFKWANVNGRWVVQDVPLGDGMVDFTAYFRMLKRANLRAPMTLHVEYPMGGAEHGAAKLSIPAHKLFTAIKRDLTKLQELWKSA